MSGMAQPPVDYSVTEPAADGGRLRRSPAGVGWGWWVALVAVVLAALLAALLALDDGLEPTRTVGVAAIMAEPAAYEGDRLVVSARIDELLTDRVVTVGSDLAADDLLVLIAPNAFVGGYGVGVPMSVPLPAGQAYEPGDVVQFAGTVRAFDRDTMSEDLGLVLDDELFGPYDDEPALVADRLDVTTVGRLADG